MAGGVGDRLLEERPGVRQLEPRDEHLGAEQAQSPRPLRVVGGIDARERVGGSLQRAGRVAEVERLLCLLERRGETARALSRAGGREEKRQGDGDPCHFSPEPVS